MITSSLGFTSLVVPVAAWAIAAQFSQILPYADCRDQTHWTLLACGAVIAGSVIVILGELRHARREKKGATSTVVDFLWALTGLLFVYALGLQLAASILVSACEH